MILRLFTPLLIAVLMLGATVSGAAAAEAVRPQLSPDDVATINRAESYLNKLISVQARFVQISSNGAYAEGEVIVARPGKMRFEYDPPHPALLIADGLTLLFYDREVKQATFLPLWETPLWFLIREKIQLSGNVSITAVERGPGSLRLSLVDSDSEDSGEITLVFSDQPLALKKWEVVDAQGITTQVSLINPKFDIQIDAKNFDYSDLEIYQQDRTNTR